MVFDIILSPSLRGISERLGFKPVILDKSLIIRTEKRDELMKKVSSYHAKNIPVIVLGSTDEINRMALEDKRVDMLLSPEELRKKDFMKWKNSGLNHVLCRLAAQNNIKIGISFSAIKHLESKERSLRLSRIMQNIILCRKYSTKIVLASFAESESDLLSPYELRSLGIVMGMTPKQANESLENAKEMFENQFFTLQQ